MILIRLLSCVMNCFSGVVRQSGKLTESYYAASWDREKGGESLVGYVLEAIY